MFGAFCFSNAQRVLNMKHSNAQRLKHYETLWLPYYTYLRLSRYPQTQYLTVYTGLNIIIFTIYLATVQLQCEVYATITLTNIIVR